MDVEHCRFYLERKKRYCRMTVKNGNQYCGEHILACEYDDKKSQTKLRIVCPLDKSHSCFESKLKQHLKVCNAKRMLDTRPEYIVEGINRGDVHLTIPQHISLKDLDQSVIDHIITKIETAYDKLPEVEELLLQHEVLDTEMNNPIYGDDSRRHIIQNSSLLGHLRYAGLIKENTCFIEFGAGRGKLTYWLARAIQVQSTLLLVDRSSPRHKNDNKLKNDDNIIKRIRADIADLDLNKIENIKNSVNIVGIAKHLCGAATDLTMRCLGQLIDTQNPKKIGLVIAICCHHASDYCAYVGKDFLEESGFHPQEYQLLCTMASWATCSIKCDALRPDKRELIGRKIKMLLNWGRVEYLKSRGFTESHLYYYTTTGVSLENMCIVAIRQCPS